MEAIIDSLRSIKLWQATVLVTVLIGGAAAAYAVYAVVDSSDDVALAEDEQVIPVQYGDLVNQVSVSGSLKYPERETLTFGSQGTVSELLVEEGQSVTEGQPLAVLDSATTASLENAVAKARVSLQDAQDALDKAKNPHTTLDLAQAKAAVANAQVSVRDAQDALDRLLESDPQTVAQTESAAASARLALQAAEDALAELLEPPTELEIAKAEAAITSASVAAERAREALDSATAGPDEGEIADAELQIELATASLDIAKRELTILQDEWDGKLEAAAQAYEDAIEAYDDSIEAYGDVFKGWLGIVLSEEEEKQNPDTLLAAWDVDLDSLFNPASAPNPFYGIPPDDPDTRWDEAAIFTRTFLYPGTLLGTCDNVTLTGQVQCVKREMDDAWDAIPEVEDGTETVEIQRDKAIANAEKAVTQAEVSLANDQDALAELFETTDDLEVEDLDRQLDVAVAALQKAEDDLDKLMVEPDILEVEAKQKQIALARANLDKAEDDLEELTSDPDPVDVEAKQLQIEVAQAKLAEAEEELDELLGSVDPLEVALRESDLASARAALEEAIQRVGDATLTAPWDGVVSLITVDVGQDVNPNTAIMEIVDPTVIEVDGIVDEIDVLFIQIGAQAQVTMDALAGQVLQGAVSDVATEAQSQQGVVSYPISIAVEAPQGVELPEGLSATANVVIREEKDVLLVPIQSLYGSYQQPLVRVLSDGEIEERPVTVGNSDDFWVVVLDGLTEGEQVVIEAEEASTGGFGGFGGVGVIRQFTSTGGPGGGGRPR